MQKEDNDSDVDIEFSSDEGGEDGEENFIIDDEDDGASIGGAERNTFATFE